MARSIPSYELYGELLAGRAPDPIHIEPIRERSSQHDWVIRVHSHARIAQVFLFRSSDVRFSVGDIEHRTTCPTILVVHPGQPHGFHFSEDVDGDVLSIRINQASAALRERFAVFQAPISGIFADPDTPRFTEISDLFRQLHGAYHGFGPRRAEVLAVLVDLITLYLVEAQSNKVGPRLTKSINPQDRLDIRVQEFCVLLEEHFHESWPVSDYASLMRLSASHLTRICRAVLGAPPNALVRQRRILEAKRLLEYTSMPVSDIGLRCGFRDTAFFSRTFKSLVGMAPHAYRSRLNQ